MPKQKYWDGTAWQEIGASANKVTITDPGNIISATNVETALQEIVKNPSNVQKVPTATGTGTAIILATDKGNFLLSDGYSVTFKASANNSGSATTINIDGKGAKSIYKPGTTTAPTLISGKYYTIVYSSSSNCFFIKASATGTATPAQVLAGVPFSNENDTDLVGTIPSKAAATYTPTTTNQTIAAGQYLSGTQTIAGDADLIAANIKSGKNIFGVTGSVVEATGNAVAGNVLSGKTFSKAGSAGLTGTMPNRGSKTFTPTKSTQTGSSGYYSSVVCNPIPNNYYGVGDRVSSNKFKSLFEQMWSFTNHTDYVYGVAADNNGNAYTVSNDTTVRKINSSGNQIWAYTGFSESVLGVAVDDNGNVYAGGYEGVRKISSSGNQIWSFTGHSNTVTSVAVDGSGNVYSGGLDYTVRKISSSGSQIWSFTGHSAAVFAVAVDNGGNVYSGGSDYTVRKISSSGNQIWSFTGHSNTVRGIAVDGSGNVYSGSQDATVRKISSSGSQIWMSMIDSYIVYVVAVDNGGNVYAGGIDEILMIFTNDGREAEAFTGYSSTIRGIAVSDYGVYCTGHDSTVRKLFYGIEMIA